MLQVLTATIMKMTAFRDVAPCNLVEADRRFRNAYHLYQQVKGKAIPLHAMEALGGRGGIAPTHSRPRH
jgi:hypothetical protein